jgi:hypothetical protein
MKATRNNAALTANESTSEITICEAPNLAIGAGLTAQIKEPIHIDLKDIGAVAR